MTRQFGEIDLAYMHDPEHQKEVQKERDVIMAKRWASAHIKSARRFCEMDPRQVHDPDHVKMVQRERSQMISLGLDPDYYLSEPEHEPEPEPERRQKSQIAKFVIGGCIVTVMAACMVRGRW